jgi:hypothetical protein
MVESIAIPPRRWLEFIPEPRASRGVAAWGVPAVGGIVAVALAAMVLATGSDAQGNESDGAAIEATDAEPEVAAASVAPTPEPEPEKVIEPAPAKKEAEPVPANAIAPAVEPAPRVRTQPVIEPMTPAQLRKAQRVARQLDAAIADGRVKTSSLSFAVVVEAEGTFFSEAATMCNELVVDGVGGWRLPSVGELRDLGRARTLPGAAYWSRTRASDPEMVRVYNTRTRRSGAWLQSEPTGSAVCVQAKPRA